MPSAPLLLLRGSAATVAISALKHPLRMRFLHAGCRIRSPKQCLLLPSVIAMHFASEASKYASMRPLHAQASFSRCRIVSQMPLLVTRFDTLLKLF